MEEMLFRNGGKVWKAGGRGTNATVLGGGLFFNNTGALDVQVNLLSLQGGGSFTGGFVTGAPGLIQLAAGAYTINGTITTTKVQLAGGTLTGANVIAGGFDWVVGSWNGAAGTVASNALFDITPANNHDLPNSIVPNYGTVALRGRTLARGGGTTTSYHTSTPV